MYSGTDFGFTPPMFPGVCGVALGLGFIPPILVGVFGCVCSCARSDCTPPVLARVYRLGVCA